MRLSYEIIVIGTREYYTVICCVKITIHDKQKNKKKKNDNERRRPVVVGGKARANPYLGRPRRAIGCVRTRAHRYYDCTTVSRDSASVAASRPVSVLNCRRRRAAVRNATAAHTRAPSAAAVAVENGKYRSAVVVGRLFSSIRSRPNRGRRSAYII